MAAIVATATAAALGGCSADSESVDPDTARNMAYFAEAADRAAAGGATDEQVEVLRGAAATGELTSAQVTPLLESFFGCLAQYGMEGETEGTMQVGPGVALPQIVVAFPGFDMDDDDVRNAAIAKSDSCESEHMGYAWQAIQLAPTTVDAWDADFAARAPAVIACLRENGGSVDDDAPVDEIVQVALEVVERTGTSCMSER